MLYQKNLYGWEQALRFIVSVGAIIYAVTSLTGILEIAVAASGVIFAITGIVGWCPACAMVGRKLKTKQGNS